MDKDEDSKNKQEKTNTKKTEKSLSFNDDYPRKQVSTKSIMDEDYPRIKIKR